MKVKDPAAIARWRKRRHLSQRDLGYLCQCSQQAISFIETGKLQNLTEQLANSLARRLDVPWEELFEQREVIRMPSVANVESSVDVQASA